MILELDYFQEMEKTKERMRSVQQNFGTCFRWDLVLWQGRMLAQLHQWDSTGRSRKWKLQQCSRLSRWLRDPEEVRIPGRFGKASCKFTCLKNFRSKLAACARNRRCSMLSQNVKLHLQKATLAVRQVFRVLPLGILTPGLNTCSIISCTIWDNSTVSTLTRQEFQVIFISYCRLLALDPIRTFLLIFK